MIKQSVAKGWINRHIIRGCTCSYVDMVNARAVFLENCPGEIVIKVFFSKTEFKEKVIHFVNFPGIRVKLTHLFIMLLLLHVPDMKMSCISVQHMVKLWKQLMLQSFSTLTVVWLITIQWSSTKSVMVQKNALWFSHFSTGTTHFSVQKRSAPIQHLTPTSPLLSQRDSAPAILQFLPATFFQFENPVLMDFCARKTSLSLK